MRSEGIRSLIEAYTAGRVSDTRMTAWLRQVCERGMTSAETLALTEAMVESGERLDWSHLPRPALDKHSTGGVGDKTSLVLVPLMAAAGLPFVKMSGRGLGHTGGTLDKLESIPGFRVAIPLSDLRRQVGRIGCALVGQSSELVPADGKLYALRDATGTVASVPLIASSIMSKKLAAGARVIVLDVKYGSGAFMHTIDEARELAAAMVAIGEGSGRRVRAILSTMEEPLGRAVGNALEVREAIDTLRGGGPADLWVLTRELGAHQLVLAGAAKDLEAARRRLDELRDSGAAAGKLRALVEAQGGDAGVVDDPGRLPSAPIVREITLTGAEPSRVEALNARGVAAAALTLGAGRRMKGDTVDPAVGVVLRAKTGDEVTGSAPLAWVHARDEDSAAEAEALLRRAYRLSEAAVPMPPTAFEVVGGAS